MSTSGLTKAPVSKGVLAIATLTTLGASAYKASARLGLSLDTLVGRREVWRIFTCHFAFSTAGELVLGLVLLYTFRQFERHWGSRRFGSFLFLSSSLSSLIGVGFLALLRNSSPNLIFAGGPYGIIFASLVQYYFDIPTVNQVRVFGFAASPKTVTYLLALQLAVATPGSTLASLSGLLAGLAYRSRVLSLRRFALPAPLCNVFAALFLPFLASPPAQHPPHPQRGQRGEYGRGQPVPRDQAYGGFQDEQAIPAWAMNNLHQRPQAAPQAAPRQWTEEQMVMLAGMGFEDRARNTRLLDMYDGDVHRVIDELCRE